MITTLLELSKELSKLIEVETYYSWASHPELNGGEPTQVETERSNTGRWEYICPAYTTDELWDILPEKIEIAWGLLYLTQEKDGGDTIVSYDTIEFGSDIVPDAYAKMIIYLKEKELI